MLFFLPVRCELFRQMNINPVQVYSHYNFNYDYQGLMSIKVAAAARSTS